MGNIPCFRSNLSGFLPALKRGAPWQAYNRRLYWA